VKRDLLRTFGQLLYFLTAEHQFAFDFDELQVSAQSVGGLLKDAVAFRAHEALINKVDDDK